MREHETSDRDLGAPLQRLCADRGCNDGGGTAITCFLIALGSNVASSDRDQKTTSALALAKQALIARAISDISLPGSFPCPDIVTHLGTNVPNDGVADLFAGINCPAYVGRLPWRTLALPDVRDSKGERLWYALSPNFRDYASQVTIKDTTVGTLSVSGSRSVHNVVAIVFSAGAPLARQLRDGALHQNDVANYLEGLNAQGGPAFSSQAADANFNDQLLVITVADLMAGIEKRVTNELNTLLNRYFIAHSVFPRPADSTDVSCLPEGDPNMCIPSTTIWSGLLPRNLTPGSGWSGIVFPPWFEKNWRTAVRYTVAPECTTLPACSSTVFSAMTDAGIFPPSATLVIGSVTTLTVQIVAH